jgi:hypothetical protein
MNGAWLAVFQEFSEFLGDSSLVFGRIVRFKNQLRFTMICTYALSLTGL